MRGSFASVCVYLTLPKSQCRALPCNGSGLLAIEPLLGGLHCVHSFLSHDFRKLSGVPAGELVGGSIVQTCAGMVRFAWQMCFIVVPDAAYHLQVLDHDRPHL